MARDFKLNYKTAKNSAKNDKGLQGFDFNKKGARNTAKNDKIIRNIAKTTKISTSMPRGLEKPPRTTNGFNLNEKSRNHCKE